MTDDPATHTADGRPRARGLGLPLAGTPGRWNAITDVAGVEVGLTTLVRDLAGGVAVRTGVTAILPRGRTRAGWPVWGGLHALNGNGELTGAHWLRESGELTGPICITNTHSVGIAHHAICGWLADKRPPRVAPWLLPVVAETSDAWLNDMNGRHVAEADVVAALEGATRGPVAEGSVGGGTGMTSFDYKAGTGTASRCVDVAARTLTVAVLVQSNFGRRHQLTVCGVPYEPGRAAAGGAPHKEQGSIIGVLATDAPLLPVQLQRLARRMPLGLARTGGIAGNGSGDIFLAFTIANPPETRSPDGLMRLDALPHDQLDPLFNAAIETVEEAILNALVTAGPMTGHLGRHAPVIDLERLRAIAAASH
jgi:D-aminopeptidase